MSALASSSRSRVAQEAAKASISRRTVVHHARPPRQPMLRAPQTPRARLPTAGTSYPNPSSSSTQAAYPRSAPIHGTNYTLHHAPPPSAPSYSTGTLPPFLQWCQGRSVNLTGEEKAPKRKERKREIEGGLGWDEGILAKMRQMRTDGMTRRQVGEALSIPTDLQHLIARAAPATAEQHRTRELQLEDQKATWGYRKRLSREMRQKRKEFW